MPFFMKLDFKDYTCNDQRHIVTHLAVTKFTFFKAIQRRKEQDDDFVSINSVSADSANAS